MIHDDHVVESTTSLLFSLLIHYTCISTTTGSEIKLQDVKTEPSGMFFGSPFSSMSNDSKQGLVSVAITLRPQAAEVRELKFFTLSQ